MKNQLSFLTILMAISLLAVSASRANVDENLAGLEESLAFLKKVSPFAFPQEAGVERLKAISSISVREQKITDDDFIKYIVPLCPLDNINGLFFVYNSMSGEGLRVLQERCGAWKSILTADFGGNPLVDEYLLALKMFPNLEILNVDFHGKGTISQITGEFLKNLHLPKLKSIWGTGTSITDENALEVLKFPLLEDVNFNGAPLSVEVVAKIRRETIRQWDINEAREANEKAKLCGFGDSVRFSAYNEAVEGHLITEQAAEYLRNHGVYLSFNREAGVTTISRFCKVYTLEDTLRFLKERGANGFDGNADIDTLKSANSIGMLDGTITDDDFKYLTPLCALTNIKRLDFRFNRLTGDGFRVLSHGCLDRWNSVRGIDLGGNPLEENGLRGLWIFSSLEDLNVDFHDEGGKSKLTGEFIEYLPESVKSIWATGTSITDKNALAILNIPSLEIFNFWGVPLSKEVLDRLAVEKINMSAMPWDLRRTQYEIKNTYECFSENDPEEKADEISKALELSLISDESAEYLKTSDTSFYVVKMGRAIFPMVCKNKVSDSLNHDEL